MKPPIDPFNKPQHLIKVLRTEGDTVRITPDEAGLDLLIERLIDIGVDLDLVTNNEFLMHLTESFEARGILCVLHSDSNTCVAISKPETTTL